MPFHGKHAIAPPVRSGHSKVVKLRLTESQLQQLRRHGSVNIRIPDEVIEKLIPKGRKPANTVVTVRKSCVKDGCIWVYARSGKHPRISVRNFNIDYKRHAKHRYYPGKPQTGD